MNRVAQFAAITAAAALTMTACGSAPEDTPTTSAGASAGATAVDGFKPCIVSDQGGFDDKSFNQLSYEGLVKAAEELDVEFGEVQSTSESDFMPNLESLISTDCTAIVSVGFALSVPTVEVAKANPELEFILVDDAADNDFDGTTDADNVKPLVYDTAQAAFLAGYLSAGFSETGKVGTFGGQPFPTVTIFMDGFKQGVEHYNKVNSTTVQVIGFEGGDQGVFTGAFANNQDARSAADSIIDQGVDVILPVGGPIYQAALDSIAASGRSVALIGVDADIVLTDPSTADYALTSIQKTMDLSTYEAVLAAGNGEFDPTAYVGTLENEGVGLAPLHNFEDKVDPALLAEVEDLKAQIIAGEVTVESYLNN